MTPLQTFIEEQEKDFEGLMTSLDTFGGFYNGNKNGIELYNFNNVFNWHKQSLISFLRMEIEIAKGKKEECNMCENHPSSNVGHDLHVHTHNKVIEHQITHYKQYIKTLEG